MSWRSPVLRSPRPRRVGGSHWERLIRAEMRPPSPLAGSSLGPLLGGAAALAGLHCASEGLKHTFKVSCAALPPAVSLDLSHTCGFYIICSCFWSFACICFSRKCKNCTTHVNMFWWINNAHLQLRIPIGGLTTGTKTFGTLRPL